MTRPIEIGVGLWDPRVDPEERLDPWRMIEVAELADRMGITFLAMPDRVSRPVPRFDTLTLMAALALRTQQVRFLTHVFVTPLRQPIELARRIVTVDHLSRGRFIFGVGLGGGERVGRPELSVYHKEFADVGVALNERGGRTDEILQVLIKLWTEPVASFTGRFYRFRDVVFEPKPYQQPHPPIWVGGNSEAALRRAARFGSGWAGSLESVSVRLGSAQEGIKRLHGYLQAEGKDPAAFHLSTTVRVHIDPDRKKAQAEAGRFWDMQRSSTEGARPFDLKQGYAAYGPGGLVVEKIQEMSELGLNSVILYIHAFDLRKQLQRLEGEVLARVG